MSVNNLEYIELEGGQLEGGAAGIAHGNLGQEQTVTV